jgi:hypothetical protein
VPATHSGRRARDGVRGGVDWGVGCSVDKTVIPDVIE